MHDLASLVKQNRKNIKRPILKLGLPEDNLTSPKNQLVPMADLQKRMPIEKHVGVASDSDPEEIDAFPAAVMENLSKRPQTGPKGVLEDYRKYSELKKLEQQEEKLQRIIEHKQQSFTADPNKHKVAEDEDDDEFLKRYHEKRLSQLQKQLSENDKNVQVFSKLFSMSSLELSDDLQKEDKQFIIVVHLYDAKVPLCSQMNSCLECLSKQYPYVKFAKVLASEAGLSLQFQMHALPALQVYKGGELIGNYLKMKDHLDSEFYASDVENFLIDSHVLDGVCATAILE